MAARRSKLTDKQAKFVDEYLIDLNATQAAIRAGYSAKNAFKIGSDLLHKSTVQAQLLKKRAKLQERTEVTQDRIILELAKTAFVDPTDFVDVGGGYVRVKTNAEMPQGMKGAIAGIKETQSGVEIKFNDKLRALELLGKHLGMFSGAPIPDKDEPELSALYNALEGDDDA